MAKNAADMGILLDIMQTDSRVENDSFAKAARTKLGIGLLDPAVW